MKALQELVFRRKFSFNPYKALKLPLAEMSCHKDWPHARTGDPYPMVQREGVILDESIRDQRYHLENSQKESGRLARFVCSYFPYATYAIGLDTTEGSAGLRIVTSSEPGSDYQPAYKLTVWVMAEVRNGKGFLYGEKQIGTASRFKVNLAENLPVVSDSKIIVTSRGGFLDLYWETGQQLTSVGTWQVPELAPSLMYHNFIGMVAAVEVRLEPGQRVSCTAQSYLDGGISHADVKCMRYENGQPIMTDGRLYLTMSAREEQGGYEAVVSWNPSSCDFSLEGALFFDYGDDIWCSDVASTVIYDRRTRLWYVWACAFSHGHVLCHAVSKADLRHGIHVLDATRMPAEIREQVEGDELSIQSGAQCGECFSVSDDRLFYAKSGDEDPDLVWDEMRKRWLLAICRSVTLENGKSAYRYFVFESQSPLDGFELIGQTTSGENTGGSFIRYQEQLYLLCGSDFASTSQYRLHSLEHMDQYSLLRFNYPDGGFRGWGTLIPVPCGSRTRYMHITFDRQGGSPWRWSYGNLYVFEADMMSRTQEWEQEALC